MSISVGEHSVGVFVDMVTEVVAPEGTSTLTTRRKTKEGGWKCFLNMESQLYWIPDGGSINEKSIVYDKDLRRKKPETHSKPILWYNDIDYSWITGKEVIVEKGDYIFIGVKHFCEEKLHSGRGRAYRYKIFFDSYILRVNKITEREGLATIRFEQIAKYTDIDENKLDIFLDSLNPNFRKGVTKSFIFSRDGINKDYWFEGDTSGYKDWNECYIGGVSYHAPYRY